MKTALQVFRRQEPRMEIEAGASGEEVISEEEPAGGVDPVVAPDS